MKMITSGTFAHIPEYWKKQIRTKNKVMNNRIYLPAIDGLRFLAFLFVFIHHSVTHTSKLGSFLHDYGWFGVELFFILSSFLLAKLLILEYERNNTVSIYKYFLRRILRIWPLYFAYISFCILCLLLFKYDARINYFRLLGLFTFTDNIITAFQGFNTLPFSAHLWTISFEEQFYILLPFLIPIIVRANSMNFYSSISLVWIILLFLRFLSVINNMQHPFIWTLIIQGDALLVGIILAIFKNNSTHKISNLLLMISGVAIISILVFTPNCNVVGYNQIYIYTIIAMGFGVIVYAILQSNNIVIRKILCNRAICYLGKISYGLYIFHFFCIYFIARICARFGIGNWYVIFILGLALTILISMLSYELFEKRFLNLKEKFTIIKSRPV
jgi:peptidoglycan/LPS O-acetylase OafA/YrhL